MKYIKLRHLIRNFFKLIPLFMGLFFIFYIFSYSLVKGLSADFSLKLMLTPSKFANEQVEGKLLSLVRLNSQAFKKKYVDAGGESKFLVALNKHGMIGIEFKSDNKEILLDDADIFLKQVNLAADRTIEENFSAHNEIIEGYKAEANRLKQYAAEIRKYGNGSVSNEMDALVVSTRDTELSSKILNMNAKIINSNNHKKAKWFVDSYPSPVNNNLKILLMSLALSFSVYIIVLLRRYGYAKDE